MPFPYLRGSPSCFLLVSLLISFCFPLVSLLRVLPRKYTVNLEASKRCEKTHTYLMFYIPCQNYRLSFANGGRGGAVTRQAGERSRLPASFQLFH